MTAMKTRTIAVDNISCAGCEKTISDLLADMDGIQEVRVDSQSGKVSVVYDLLKTDLEKIERKIGEAGYLIHENLFNRLKDTYIHFAETNERDNLTAPPMPCCSHADDVIGKKR